MPTNPPAFEVCPSQPAASTAAERLLASACEFVGASEGWIVVADAGGHLQVAAQRGTVPEEWLPSPSGNLSAWGIEVGKTPCLLNALPSFPSARYVALQNLLTCPLPGTSSPSGYLALANKPEGFTSQDAAVLQGFAHHVGRELDRADKEVLSSALRLVLEQASGGVVAVDEEGTLLFVNTTWCDWVGFKKEELEGQKAPFPFWVSLQELAAPGPVMSRQQPESPQVAGLRCLPFKGRNGAVLWCETRTVTENLEGRRLTLAFLNRLPEVDQALPATTARSAKRAEPGPLSWEHLAASLTFPALLANADGRVLWANPACDQLLPRSAELVGHPLRECFDPGSAAVLQRLFRDPEAGETGRMGRVFLQPLGERRDSPGTTAYWLPVPLAEGTGFLLAFPEGEEDLAWTHDPAGPWPRTLLHPAADWNVLVIRPDGIVEGWDERWEDLTGLASTDIRGVRGDILLDWLLPQQRDRDLVADLLHQPHRRGLQAVLEVVSRSGSRPLLCTFLPAGTKGEAGWLLLVGETELSAAASTLVRRYLRQFSGGLSRLLNHYLTPPIGLSEMALDRLMSGTTSPPLEPAEAGTWFGQILESCLRASHLVEALQHLAAASPGDTQLLPVAEVVRDFLADQHPTGQPRDYHLSLDLRDAEAAVRVNRRMMNVVLGHLLRNAEQAVQNQAQRQVEVRLFATSEEVCVEVEDSGEGLPTDDWTAVLAPFFSTKGPFARDAAHAAQEATGLGLTVSHHLLTIHGGRLELRRNQVGTTAAMVLPRVRTGTADSRLPLGGAVASRESLEPSGLFSE